MTLVHEELSYKILGALFEVNREVGYGHREVVYQKAIAACLRQRKIPFQEQVRFDLIVADEKIGMIILDFFIDGKIVLELKAHNNFRTADYRQVQAYLKKTGVQLAILATFSSTGVRYKRIVNIPNFKDSSLIPCP